MGSVLSIPEPLRLCVSCSKQLSDSTSGGLAELDFTDNRNGYSSIRTTSQVTLKHKQEHICRDVFVVPPGEVGAMGSG